MEATTPGPWEWVNRPGERVFLAAPHSGLLTVMDFVRQGMCGAQPRFSDRNGERRGGLMHRTADRNINEFPDARLIAAAPDLLEAAKRVAAFALSWEPLTSGDIADLRAAIVKAEGSAD